MITETWKRRPSMPIVWFLILVAAVLLALIPAHSARAQSCATEAEPNSRADAANAIADAACIDGVLEGRDIDFFRFPVDEALAQLQFDLQLTPAAAAPLELCLRDELGRAIQCRAGESPALVDLVLPQGEAIVSVENRDRTSVAYRLEQRLPGAVRAGYEQEPNDTVGSPSPMGELLAVRGRFAGTEDDVYAIAVTGLPQLWRIQAMGDGVQYMAYHDAAGAEIKRHQRHDDGPVRMDGLYLLPGVHLVRVRGTDGDYTLRVIPQGPPAAAPLPQDDVDAQLAATAPTMPAAPADEVDGGDLGAPAVAVTEREPNDDASRAHALRMGAPQSGLLASPDDRDQYRFYLGAPSYVRLAVTPPPDAAVDLDLEGFFSNANQGIGAPLVLDLLLPPGDHFLNLDSDQASGRPYTILLQPLDPYLLPADLEPVNNQQAGAQPVPGSLALTGRIAGRVDDQDWYRLPQLDQGTALTIEVEGDVTNLALYSADGQQLPNGTWDRRAGAYAITVPAGLAPDLRVRADGAYTLALSLDPPLDLPLGGRLPVALSLAADETAVAGFWRAGQRLDLSLDLRNDGDAPQTLQVDAVTSHYAWQPVLAETALTLAPGESRTLPLTVLVHPDARTDIPVQLTVAARNGDGAIATAGVDLAAICGAEPVRSDLTWTTAGPLLGGLNAAWPALGARPDSEDTRLVELLDPIVSPSTGWRGAPGTAVTVELAGDEPVPVAGFLLNPQGPTSPAQQLREFAVDLSADGSNWTPVLTDVLGRAPTEQAFVLDAAVPARFARLHLLSSHEGGTVTGLGSFKVVAAPDDETVGTAGFNLADPALGGHLVNSLPYLFRSDALLTGTLEKPSLRLDPVEQVEWTVGFHHDRAAQLQAMEWRNWPGGRPDQRFDAVDVFLSADSPVGPWQSVGAWDLDPASEDIQTFTFDEPTWARYVRFVAPGKTERATFEYPDLLRFWERPADGEYRSILAEYGQYRQEAIYELLNAAETSATVAEADDNDSQARAQPLAGGETVRGTVVVGEDEDWYRFDVPADANLLRVTVQGDPAVNVLYELVDAAGAAVPYDLDGGVNQQMLTARVEPGSYFLHIEEPVRSVIFAWDTSGSVSPYRNQTYQSLVQFAEEIDPRYEVVNLLPFHDPGPLLLPEWSGDPTQVMAALTNYGREHDSSDAEINLLKATQELGARPGTRAVVFLTDAESGGYNLSDELWLALRDVQPRVFTLEMSSRGSEHAQDLMQDWADVNQGHYAYMSSIGELELGFARASCLLRRPAVYRVSVAFDFDAPPPPTPTPAPEPTATPTPTPVPTATTTSIPTATPTATPEPTATATATSTPQPTATATLAGPGTIALVTAAGDADLLGGTAVELILDASGSMLQSLDGVRRIDVAKAVLRDLVDNVLPSGVPLALRVFGHIQPDACRTDLVAPLQPLERAAVGQLLAGIEARNLARTPIADSLALVAQDLAGATGQKVVILVTDGEETCDGDPAAAVRSLQEQGIDVRLNIVGFAIADPALKAQFEEWATLGGGFYFDATSAAELNAAIRQAVRVPFRLVDASGATVGTGFVDGDPIQVPAGTYTVEVLSEPVRRIEGVAVGGGQNPVITVDSAP